MTKATYSNSKDPKQKHRFKNLLLQPVIQLRIAAWSAFASAMFGFAISLVFYYSLRGISNAFADIGHLDDEAQHTGLFTDDTDADHHVANPTQGFAIGTQHDHPCQPRRVYPVHRRHDYKE